MGFSDNYCDVEVPDAEDLGMLHPDEHDCEWCGESFPGDELYEEDDGSLVCNGCCGALSDYDDRMSERRQMGLLGF